MIFRSFKNQMFCKGITKKGIRCKRICNKRDYCFSHLVIKAHEKPLECAVCFEEMSDKKPLSCGHWIHKDCIIKSGKAICPICRTDLILDKKSIKEIKIVNDKHIIDNLNEERDALIREFYEQQLSQLQQGVYRINILNQNENATIDMTDIFDNLLQNDNVFYILLGESEEISTDSEVD